MIAAPVVLCCYLLTGVVIAGGSNIIFINGGFDKLCFSMKETALIAVAWPYFLLAILLKRN